MVLPEAKGQGRDDVVKRYYIANDDHTDYMWAADEGEYRTAFLNMLDYYMTQAEETAGEPADEQGKFNCDGTIWIWEFERNRPPEEVDRLIEHLRDGSITVPLNTLVQLYGAMPTEAVLRSFYYAGHLERREGLDLRLVVPMENQTLPGGVASLWAGSGAEFSWKGICGCATQINAADRPREIYHFLGPDGHGVLMKWNSMLWGNMSLGGYSEARDPYQAVNLMSSNATFLARWPYDVAGAFGYGWDDVQSMTTLFLQASHDLADSTRRVIVSNEIDFFEDFEATHGGQIELFSASFGNEWDLLSASMGEVSAKVKRSIEKLRTAEALAAIVSLYDPDFMLPYEAARDSAMIACGLYYEHCWTPGPGVNEAERAAWQRAVQGTISRYVDDLYEGAFTGLAVRVETPPGVERHVVFNPLSWERTDFADLDVTMAPPLHVVDVETGIEVASQMISVDGEERIRILAEEVPPVGYRVYEVRAGEGESFPLSAEVNLPSMENATYAVTLGTRGEVTSLIDHKDGDRQLVGAGAALHDFGDGNATVTLESSGPVSTTLAIDAGGTPSHQTRVTLYGGGIDRIEVEGRVTQNFGSRVVSAWDFNLDGGLWRHEEVGMIARVARASNGGDYADQNARTDHLTFNHFADLSTGERGVTLSSRDAQFFRIGSSTPSSLDATSTRLEAVVGMQVDGTWLGIRNQGGDSDFLDRFALTTHAGFDPAASMRMALEHQNPLAARRVVDAGEEPLPSARYSLLSFDSQDVLLWALKPAEEGPGDGLILRAWNLAEETRSWSAHLHSHTIVDAREVTHIETDRGAAVHTDTSISAEFERQQIRSFLLVLEEASGVQEGNERRRSIVITPNPASGRVERAIRFSLGRTGPVRISLYDPEGGLVETILDGTLEAGLHSIRWRGEGKSAGVYFVRVEANGRVERSRLILLD